eukprot:Rmarinus@m.10751
MLPGIFSLLCSIFTLIYQCNAAGPCPLVQLSCNATQAVLPFKTTLQFKWGTNGDLSEDSLMLNIRSNNETVRSSRVPPTGKLTMDGLLPGLLDVTIYAVRDGTTEFSLCNGQPIASHALLRSIPMVFPGFNMMAACLGGQREDVSHLNFWNGQNVSLSLVYSSLSVPSPDLEFWLALVGNQYLHGVELLDLRQSLKLEGYLGTAWEHELMKSWRRQQPLPNLLVVDTQMEDPLNPLFAAALSAHGDYLLFPTVDDLLWPGFVTDVIEMLSARKPDFVLAASDPMESSLSHRLLAVRRRILFPNHCGDLTSRIGKRWHFNEKVRLSEMVNAGLLSAVEGKATWRELSATYVQSFVNDGRTGIMYSPVPTPKEWLKRWLASDVKGFSWETAVRVVPSPDRQDMEPADDDSVSCAALYPSSVFFLRVPKTASTTMQMIIDEVNCTLGYMHVPIVLQGSTAGIVRNYYVHDAWSELFSEEAMKHDKLLMDGHVYWIREEEFAERGVAPPMWFSLVRDPIKRIASLYDYLRWGPYRAPAHVDLSRDDFPEVEQTMETCLENFRSAKTPSRPAECVGFNPMLRYFCGKDPWCQDGSRQGLHQAKRNIRDHFAVVGLSDRFGEFTQVLERVLPEFFSGASVVASDFARRNVNQSKKSQLSDEDMSLLLKANALDIELYEWIRHRFDRQYHACFNM